jgi:hypothetical protein
MGADAANAHGRSNKSFLVLFFKKEPLRRINESSITALGLHLRQPCLGGFSHGDAGRLPYTGAARMCVAK